MLDLQVPDIRENQVPDVRENHRTVTADTLRDLCHRGDLVT